MSQRKQRRKQQRQEILNREYRPHFITWNRKITRIFKNEELKSHESEKKRK